MPRTLQAGGWGLLAGSALLLGAAVGYQVRLPQRLIAAVMAFGGGVLLSALSFEPMDDACHRGGFDACHRGGFDACHRGGFDSTAIGFWGADRPGRDLRTIRQTTDAPE